MSLWAIIPVKPFLDSKSRLASVLSQQERAALSREFFEHILHVLARVPAVSQTVVISRDSSALALAREYHAHTITESGAPDLNAALRRATEVAQKLGAGAVLVLPSDLPLLTDKEVQQLIEPESAEPVVVVAPDRRKTGTNALFVRPSGILNYAFGENSYAQHRARAAQAGARVRLCHLPGVALDIDLPDDLTAYREISRHQPHGKRR
jgi:2-phospho-L-lactate/phosphoenolpyruvate guanylyltransferase